MPVSGNFPPAGIRGEGVSVGRGVGDDIFNTFVGVDEGKTEETGDVDFGRIFFSCPWLDLRQT